jgi:drug/metabolite transporter (DMT)-like permease
MDNTQTKGVYLAIATAFISGIAIFVNKFAVGAIAPPLVFTATKNAGVGLLILTILFVSKKWKLISKLTKKEIVYLFSIGVIGGSIPFYLFFTGLSEASAVSVAIIHKTLVLWVAVLAIPFLQENLSKEKIIAILLLFASNFLVGGFNGFQFSKGELMILAATIFWAIENVLAKKVLTTTDPDIVTASRMGFGSIILLGTAILTAPQSLLGVFALSGTQLIWMMLTASTLLAYIATWYRALKLAPATTVSSVLVGSALVTNILSAVFVTHAWTATMGIQSLLVFVGVGIFWIATKKEVSSTNRSNFVIETSD